MSHWLPAVEMATPRAGAALPDVLDDLVGRQLTVPPPRPRGVHRQRLFERLRDDSQPLALVVAPAGYGKTTLLTDWLVHDGRRAAWASLEAGAGDGDSRRFWSVVAAALETLQPGVGRRALELLPALTPPVGPAVLPVLLQTVAEHLRIDDAGRPAVLVLDDYHVVREGAVHTELARLVDRLPPGLRLAITSREEPPLPLARWRVRNLLSEIRAADLAFTGSETAAFLRDTMRLDLPMAAITTLAQRTEGWVAALQIAALSLRGQPDLDLFLEGFRGTHRHVATYLVDEVLDREPAAAQHFLVCTAVLDRLCAPLCETLLTEAAPGPAEPAHEPAGALLDHLEAANLFLVPLDDERRWFRYHRLFSDLLLLRLRATAPGLEPVLRRRAAAWLERAGFPADALAQALAGSDWATAAGLIERLADDRWRRGDAATLDGWLAALPEEVVRARPRLAFLRAAMAHATADFAVMEPWLAAVEAGLAAEESQPDTGLTPPATVLQARVMVLRSTATRAGGDVAGARALATQALAALPPDDRGWRATLLVHELGPIALGLDDLDGAEAAFIQGAGLARAADNRPVLLRALGLRALVLHDRGRLTAATALLESARRLAASLDAEALPAMRYLDLVTGVIRLDRDDLAGATAALRSSLDRDHRQPMPILDYWEAMLATRLALAQCDVAAATATIDQADAALQSVHYYPTIPAWWEANIPAWRARIAAMRGDAAAVRDWLALVEPRADLADAPLAWWTYRSIPPMQARARLMLGAASGAAAILESLTARAEAAGAGDILLELLALQVVAQTALGHDNEAQRVLARMLVLAEPEGYVRPFLGEGDVMLGALRRHAEQAGATAGYARRLLARDEGAGAASSRPAILPARSPASTIGLPAVEPLTARELAVLRQTAAGQSNEMIGTTLGLTTGTVKWYLRVIFDKLAARRRTEAVARARELGLLD
jgi:LuxR family maltose regulon positive regulatory protein